MSANEPSTEKQRLLNALFDDPKREHVNNKMLQPTAGIEESFPTVNIKELVVSA
jgi:hypothetical protein